MLKVLIDGAADVVAAADHARAEEILRAEHARLGDALHLEQEVIEGAGEFAWDFEVLEQGFLALARPFLAEPTGIGGLYLGMLRDLGADRGENHAGILILEYMRLATRINDHFNFHDELSRHAPDFRVAERLVQLRYTAQFLNNYPRYTIRRNRFGAAADRLIRLHRWGSNVFTTVGISRACFTRWSHRRFAGVGLDPYRQNQVNALCESFLSPACVAMIVAGVDGEDERACRRAFTWLHVAIGARLERRVLDGALPGMAPEVEAAMLPVTLPGRVFLERGLALGVDGDEDRRFPRVRRVHAEVTSAAREAWDEAARTRLLEEERRAMAEFRRHLPAGRFEETAARFERALAREVVAG